MFIENNILTEAKIKDRFVSVDSDIEIACGYNKTKFVKMINVKIGDEIRNFLHFNTVNNKIYKIFNGEMLKISFEDNISLTATLDFMMNCDGIPYECRNLKIGNYCYAFEKSLQSIKKIKITNIEKIKYKGLICNLSFKYDLHTFFVMVFLLEVSI